MKGEGAHDLELLGAFRENPFAPVDAQSQWTTMQIDLLSLAREREEREAARAALRSPIRQNSNSAVVQTGSEWSKTLPQELDEDIDVGVVVSSSALLKRARKVEEEFGSEVVPMQGQAVLPRSAPVSKRARKVEVEVGSEVIPPQGQGGEVVKENEDGEDARSAVALHDEEEDACRWLLSVFFAVLAAPRVLVCLW